MSLKAPSLDILFDSMLEMLRSSMNVPIASARKSQPSGSGRDGHRNEKSDEPSSRLYFSEVSQAKNNGG